MPKDIEIIAVWNILKVPLFSFTFSVVDLGSLDFCLKLPNINHVE